jgi:pilus assembly protein CpaF
MSARILDQFSASAPARAPETIYERTKQQLHARLVTALDLVAAQKIPADALEAQLRDTLRSMIHEHPLPLTADEQEQLVNEILDEVLGYGPIERLLHEPDVTDILINGPGIVYVERKGKLEEVPVRFRDADHLMHVIHRIVGAVGRRVDEGTPMVDARLPDGSRFNAIIHPVALDGPVVSIRRFGVNPIRRADLVRLGAVPEPVMQLLEACVASRLNILVSGGTGSGKTTFLNVLSAFIPSTERIVTIEDAAELRLQQRHVVRLETRPPNLEGEGEITPRALVRNALRMRPDRIIVGEIRGDESVDMLQAMNTGHEGSISTIHANSPRHALGRLQTMVGLGMGNIQGQAIREMIGDALHLVLQVARLSDGTRRLVSITEITGMESGVISSQEIVRFRQSGVDADGRVRGVFESTGIRPAFARRLEVRGLQVPLEALQLHIEV